MITKVDIFQQQQQKTVTFQAEEEFCHLNKTVRHPKNRGQNYQKTHFGKIKKQCPEHNSNYVRSTALTWLSNDKKTKSEKNYGGYFGNFPF